MALPASGELSLGDIAVEIYGTTGNDRSLKTMGDLASKSAPYSVDSFHGYVHSP